MSRRETMESNCQLNRQHRLSIEGKLWNGNVTFNARTSLRQNFVRDAFEFLVSELCSLVVALFFML